jgi:hypothetical protein
MFGEGSVEGLAAYLLKESHARCHLQHQGGVDTGWQLAPGFGAGHDRRDGTELLLMQMRRHQAPELSVVANGDRQAAQQPAIDAVDAVEHALNQGQQVAPKAAGIGELEDRLTPPAHGFGHQLGLSGPPSVDGGLARLGPGGHGLDAHGVIADLGHQVDGGVEDGLLAGVVAGTATPSHLDLEPGSGYTALGQTGFGYIEFCYIEFRYIEFRYIEFRYTQFRRIDSGHVATVPQIRDGFVSILR